MNGSDGPFRIAYYLDAFPRRSENFIHREIAEVRKHWPALRVYCARVVEADWDYVDCREALRSIPYRDIRRGLKGSLRLHVSWLARRPNAYLSALFKSLCLYSFRDVRAIRRFDQAVKLAALAEQDGVTHLHAHFANEPAMVCHLAAALLGIAYSVSAHASDIWANRPRRAVIEGASCVAACTDEGLQHLRRSFPRAKAFLARHGIAPDDPGEAAAAPRPDPPPLRIVSAGRFVPKKGFDTLIEACGLLRDANVAYQCEIYGEGPQAPELRGLVERLGLGEQVRIHPFAPYETLKRRLRETHLCVLACRIDPRTGDRDGIPNLLLEAMNVGAIIVASRTSAIAELIRHRENGYLVSRGDPASLAETIRTALQETNLWPTLAREAYEALREAFAPGENALRLRDLIEDSVRPRSFTHLV